jgi:biotin operon repressor
MIARELGISVPTVSRVVMALRERGNDIQSQRKDDGWRYVLVRKTTNIRSSAKNELTEVQQ